MQVFYDNCRKKLASMAQEKPWLGDKFGFTFQNFNSFFPNALPMFSS